MKITDINVTKKTTREKVDEFGERVRYQEPIEVNRKVKTIQGGARFGHYLVDLAILFGLQYLIIYLGISEGRRSYYSSGGSSGFRISTDNINYLGYIVTFLYYAVSEATMGTTLGKLAFKRYVIDEYAQNPNFGTIALRSICRIVPFEAFSCLGARGWHDKWSKTYVVSKEERDFLRRELGTQIPDEEDQILDMDL